MATNWMQKYGDSRSPHQIKKLPRAEMIDTARSCCLLEHLSDADIEALTVKQIHAEIDSVVNWMERDY